MADAPTSDAEAGIIPPEEETLAELNPRPFGGLEFQVSEVIERLEASVNAHHDDDEEKPREPRKISSGFFEPEATSLDEIMGYLEELVLKSDPSSESLEPPMMPTDPVARAAILSHSIAALFGRLERSHAGRLGAHVAAETTRWMAHMFRLPDYHAFYHQEQLDGLVRVTRMLLHHRYPRYLEDGALAFSSRLPCIYSSVASPLGVVQHLCRQLGLPLACVRPVPVCEGGRGMDLDSLDRLCEEDITAGRSPMLVLGEAGAPPLGCGSALRRLRLVCDSRGAHLHLRGHGLALPAALQRNQDFDVADSLTLTPGPWFGVTGLPTVTFYRIPETVQVNDHSKAVNTPNAHDAHLDGFYIRVVLLLHELQPNANDARLASSSREGALAALAGLSGGGGRLPALPLWAAVRAAGARRITHRLNDAFRSARIFYDIVVEAGLRLLSERPGGDELPNVDIVDAVSGASACVSFQFAARGCSRPPPYYDKLNSWLGQVLQRDPDMVTIEICETEAHGIVLRYCPLEGCLLEGGRAAAVGGALAAQLHVVHATVQLRDQFREKVESHPRLRLTRLPGWAGLGGVRYVPVGWDEASEELNALNKQLVETLRATDGAFSCGDGEDGLACVRFGMVTGDTDVAELLALVAAAGGAAEAGARALGCMAEVLKRGIEEAEAELERENTARLWSGGGGVLRLVPGVGRVVEWLHPAPPPPGRRLQLEQGCLQTTADLFQHVQKKPNDPAQAHTPHKQPDT